MTLTITHIPTETIITGPGAELMDALLTPGIARRQLWTAQNVLRELQDKLREFDYYAARGPGDLKDTALDRAFARILDDMHAPAARRRLTERIAHAEGLVASAEAALRRVEAREYTEVGLLVEGIDR